MRLSAQITKGDFIQAVAAITQTAEADAAADQAVSFTDLKAGDDFYDAAASLFNAGILTSTEVRADDTLGTYA
ncbi:hypothetical protein, partial [Escherichia coli]|uniref:hypothetical protein n=1 Tax=Escherichia coli TaxID=562 RepID=UPI0022AEE223